MNTYDFDQTIFNPDSSYCFYMYCMKRYTLPVLKTIPGTLGKLADYKRHKTSAKPLKEQLFSFLPAIPDIDKTVSDFWQENKGRIVPWYLRQKKSDDIIISASPEFLLKPICDELGVRLIATRMDKYTGKIIGENCHDEEKVRRFNAEYPGAHTEKFYSDSLSDTPMAKVADRAFIVDKDNITPWPDEAFD
jgi:hypothetical protein